MLKEYCLECNTVTTQHAMTSKPIVSKEKLWYGNNNKKVQDQTILFHQTSKTHLYLTPQKITAETFFILTVTAQGFIYKF